ncbi:Rossmann-fold NAD(P)-binding domain-containing protein [Glutamicibacter soli]
MTAIARGLSGLPPEGAQFLRADRSLPGAYDAVEGEFDEIIELSYEPLLVDSALAALARRTSHWTLVSSISVYAPPWAAGGTENDALVDPQDLAQYPDAKAAAENKSRQALSKKLSIIRPDLIAGPGDLSDRLGYWMNRMAGPGPVLIPENRSRPVQFIEVRDLAGTIAGGGLPEVIDAVKPSMSFEQFLAVAAHIADYRGEFVLSPDSWLVEQGANYWAEERSLSLWLPTEDQNMLNRAGTPFTTSPRPLEQILSDVLADEKHRGLHRKRRSGLSRDFELSLVAEFQRP